MSAPLNSLQSHIVCDRLVKIFRVAESEVVALQGLEFIVDPGEMVGVVGASGSGKSTLLGILGGLVSPTAGNVVVNGVDLSALSTSELSRYRREQIGFVWQKTSRNLIPYLSALDNVMVPMGLGGGPRRNRRSRARDLLDLVGISDRASHRPIELSGGEQQRVAVAVALAAKPSLLLADEPTGELDSETADTIYRLLRKVNTELGLTQLIVSHDPGIADRVDRVVAVSDGQLASEIRARGTDGAEPSVDQVLLVDGQGRLQIPAAMLHELGIGRRVSADIEDGSLRLSPARPEDD